MISTAAYQRRAAEIIFHELARQKTSHVFLSPGSRSTPLVLAAAANDSFQMHVCIDERGAAFAALGYARATARPALLLCTSGTAAANYLPAIVEAHLDLIPIILLTADRPANVRGSGSNQTIDQLSCFAAYLRMQIDLPVPSAEDNCLQLAKTVSQLVELATDQSLSGPVQVNCQFDEPLHDHSPEAPMPDELIDWRSRQSPTERHAQTARRSSTEVKQAASEAIASAKQGLTIIGQLDSIAQQHDAAEFANRIGWPVIADICSGLSLKGGLRNRIDFSDLRVGPGAAGIADPDVVMHLGRQIVSKRIITWLSVVKPVVVQATGTSRRFDPVGLVTYQLAEPLGAIQASLRLPDNERAARAVSELVETENRVIEDCISAQLRESRQLTEIAAARTLVNCLPEQSALFLASSMPIRLVNSFAARRMADIRVFSNRGASGIDGTIASAIGTAVGSGRATTLLIGDLAMLHDLNSLSLARMLELPLVIVVFNNNGGGIFSHLPIASHADTFEDYFATPQHLSFRSAADLFGLRYVQVESTFLLQEQYAIAIRKRGITIIELTLDRTIDFAMHQNIRSAVTAELKR